MSVAVRRANAGTEERVVSIIGDGNCFFRAVITACNLKNVCAFPLQESQHMFLRNLVVDFAEQGSYNFSPFFIEYEDRATWLVEMRKDRSWADNVAIEATSDLLEVPLHIVGPHGNVIIQFGDRYHFRNPITGIDNIIRLRLQHMHYDVVV